MMTTVDFYSDDFNLKEQHSLVCGKKVYTVMVNNSSNINKMNNHLSPQLIAHKTEQDIWDCKFRSWLEEGTKMYLLYQELSSFRKYHSERTVTATWTNIIIYTLRISNFKESIGPIGTCLGRYVTLLYFSYLFVFKPTWSATLHIV
jgi:hypothetical protein